MGNSKLIKSVLVVFSALLMISSSNAQTLVTGNIFDKNGPIEFASIILKNEKNVIVNHQTTDSAGFFKITIIDKGRFSMTVSMTSYISQKKELDITTYDPIRLDTIFLVADIQSLNNIQIRAGNRLINKTSQGLIFNAAENITQISGTAADLLKNTPTVVVDPEGGISIRGKAPLILINGRNSGIGYLDRIPASSVESIEIINNPNASYDAESEAGIINIRLKKNNLVGSNGSVGIGSGFGSKGRLNSTFIYNYMSGKWNFGISYDNRFAGRTRSADAKRTNFELPEMYYLIQERHDKREEITHNGKINIDYKPNNKNEFGIEILGNKQGENNHETLLSSILNKEEAINSSNSRYSNEIRRANAADFSFNYKRKFEDSRKNFSLFANSAFNHETENTDITTSNIINGSITGFPFLQKTSNTQPTNIQTVKLDGALPLSNIIVLEAGYKAISRSVDALYKNSLKLNDVYIENAKASNNFHFNEIINAFYVRLLNEKVNEDNQKFHYDAGLRIETTSNDGKLDVGSVKFDNQYLKFFPNINLRYDPDKDQSFRISMGRRINRPGLGQLNPFIDITDSLNPHGGNPYLKPELINTYELYHQKKMNNITLSTSLYYRHAFNTIRPYISVDSNGIGLSVPKNFGNSKNYGIEEMVTIKSGRIWNMNLTVSAYQQIIDGGNIDPYAKNKLVSWYGKLIQNFNVFEGNVFQIIANYNSPVATPQGTRIEVYNVDLGMRQKVFQGNGAFGIAISDIFNTQRGGMTALASNFSYYRYFKIDTRAVLFTFTYSFKTKLKEELMENKFLND